LRWPGGHSIDIVTSHEAAPPSRNQERVVDEFREAVAIIADEAERGALYELFAATYPQLDGYQAQTIRQIPLVILRRR
jgi:hypothetical protein